VLIIPGGITILPVDSSSMTFNSRWNNNSSGGFLIHEAVIPGRITIYPIFTAKCPNRGNWRANIGSSRTENPPDGNNFIIPYSEFKFENFTKILKT
jgi:hypothetical protein